MDFNFWTYRILRSCMCEIENLAYEYKEGSEERKFLMEIYRKIQKEIVEDGKFI